MKELQQCLQIKMNTLRNNIRKLKTTELIVVKKVGRYNLIQLNNSVTVPHEIELRKKKRVYLPKNIRDKLNCEHNNKILLVKKNKRIYLEKE